MNQLVVFPLLAATSKRIRSSNFEVLFVLSLAKKEE